MPQNLKQATRALDALDSIGFSKDEFEPVSKTDAVKTACGAFIERVQQNLKNNKMIVTGEIADISIEETGDGTVEIMANPSLVYQDSGVSGTEIKYDTPYSYRDKKPPASVFIKWANERGIQERNNEKYSKKKSSFNPPNPDSIGFAIANSIYKKGIKPRPVYSNEIEKLGEDVADAAGNYVVSLITRK